LPLFDVPPRGDRGAEKISGIGAAGDPEKTGEPGSTPWQTGRKTKKTEAV